MFVATKASMLKKNGENHFESVTFQKFKKKLPTTKTVEESTAPVKASFKKEEVPDMKKLRYEIIKFGTSGFTGGLKRDANIALMVSLGAEPPKKRRMNYKKILESKKKQQEKAEGSDDKYKVLRSKFKPKSHPNIKKKKKDVKGLLDVYGQVKKSKKGGKKRKLTG